MAETKQETVDRLTAFISQYYTDVETGPGSVISELLIKLAASIQNEQYNTILTLNQGNSIKGVLNSSETTYSPVIDYVAANYNTERSSGTKVKGKIKVSVSSPTRYFFLKKYIFIQPSLQLQYLVTKDFSVSPTPSAILEEIQLYEDNGLYYFILDVEAENAGADYQVSSGTTFIANPGAYITNFVKAEAYGNFSSGRAIETDKELVAKIKSNLGNTRFESPAGILNNFSKTFSGFQSLSVCGANDIEMARAKQNVLGISTFGKADVYVRTSLGPEIKQVVKKALKISETTWEMRINNTDAPGFYYISAIIPISPMVNLGGTLVIKPQPTYGFELYDKQRNNDIPSLFDSRFTKYQTAVVTFTYEDTPNSPVGTLQDFDVHFNYQPNIKEMQDMLLLDENRLACADYLVKAVVPCTVSLKINLLKKRVTDTFDSLGLQQLKKDIFTYVNTIPFGGELHASNIVDICHNYNIRRVDLPIEMQGVIFCPDGTTISLNDYDVLTIPDLPSKGVTSKTTLYFIDYYRVEAGIAHPIDNIGLNIA
jgi:hypothetical protein